MPAAVEVLLHAASAARHEDVQVAVERFVLDLARLCSEKILLSLFCDLMSSMSNARELV